MGGRGLRLGSGILRCRELGGWVKGFGVEWERVMVRAKRDVVRREGGDGYGDNDRGNLGGSRLRGTRSTEHSEVVSPAC